MANVGVVDGGGRRGLGRGECSPQWDVSENRRNSFSAADEATLRRIDQPLKITVFLSPEDPRLTDFEQNVLQKTAALLGKLEVEYAATSRTGLFESAEDHYGEIWYELGGQKAVERSTIEEVVLDQIYTLGGRQFAGSIRRRRLFRLSIGGSTQTRRRDLLFLLATVGDSYVRGFIRRYEMKDQH